MAMSNQECIEYLEGWDRLARMDPKLRKIVVDRAVKGIKLLDEQRSKAKEDVATSLQIEKKMNDIRAMCNRVNVLMNKDVSLYMKTTELAEGNPVPEMIFLKNIILIFCEIRHVNAGQTSQEILDNLLYLYLSALKPLCRYTTCGVMCSFCEIEDCESSTCKSPEEKEETRKDFEQFLMDKRKDKE